MPASRSTSKGRRSRPSRSSRSRSRSSASATTRRTIPPGPHDHHVDKAGAVVPSAKVEPPAPASAKPDGQRVQRVLDLEERLTAAKVAHLEAEAESIRLHNETRRRDLDRESSATREPSIREIDCERAQEKVRHARGGEDAVTAPVGAGKSRAESASVEVEVRARRLPEGKELGRSGIVGAAIDRVAHAIQSVQGARNVVRSRVERLCGPIQAPEAADGQGPSANPPSGDVHELHYALSQLEGELASLHETVDRLSGL